MKVKQQTWRGPQILELAEALAPCVDRADPMAQVKAMNDANAKAIGCIAARMVELKLWTLRDACNACGQYGISFAPNEGMPGG